MTLLLLLATLFGDVPPTPPPETIDHCARPDDCVIAARPGCCACCPPQPSAMTKAQAERARSLCAAVDCAPSDCHREQCSAVEPSDHFVATCTRGQCVATRVKPAAATLTPECSADTDCALAPGSPPAEDACHASPCGCCPTLVAAPKVTKRSRPSSTPDETPPASPSPYGLSTGQPQPSCSPCPAPAPRRATCNEGRCRAVPIIRPHPAG